MDVLTGASPLLADLDRPEGAVYVAIYLGEIERGAVAVVKVAETKEMETDKIQLSKPQSTTSPPTGLRPKA